MEPMGAFSSDEWDPIGMLFSNEDLDFAQRLLSHHPCANHNQIPEMCNDHTMFGSSFVTPNPNFLNCSSFQESSYYNSNGSDNMGCGFYVPITTYNTDQYNCYYDPIQTATKEVILVPQMEEYQETDSFLTDYNSGTVIADNGLDQIQPSEEHQAVDVPATGKSRSKRKAKSEAAISDLSTVEQEDGSNGKNPKKKPRVSRDKSKKNTQPRKKQKTKKSDLKEAENMSNPKEAQISSICNSEDDSVSQELNGESALNSDGKPRANRGAATDPQSLYARKRRERINERLKTLQNLVPNGTKVDISTMLEEAVHYVKFLQLQIKLLSSDDMWMYAPIAYNGMDIGLNQIASSTTVMMRTR